MASEISPTRWLPSRRVLFVIIGILLAVGTLVFAGPIRWDQYQVDAARGALAAHDAKEAERHLGRCLGWWTGPFEIHLLSAQAAREREDYPAAQQHLDAAAKLDAKSTALLIEQALVSAEQGDTQRAENLLKSRWGNEPATALPLLIATGLGQLRNHQPIDALWCTEQALKQRPDDARALDVRGRILELVAKEEEALVHYRRAFEQAPWRTGIRLRLGEMLYFEGRPAEAADHFEKAREERDDLAAVEFGLARCWLDLADDKEAGRRLDALLTASPEHAEGLLERSRLALRQRRFTEAEKDLRHLAAIAPGDLGAQKLLRSCLAALGKQGEADACGERVLRLEAETARVSRAIEKALATTPTPEECDDVGSALLALHRAREGLAWLYVALKADPHHQATHVLLADHYRQSGAPEAARRHAEQAAFARTETP